MDEMVLNAQRFINSYNVPGIPTVEEDGTTGWDCMYALTRILQFHLNITALSDSFGPTTMSQLTQQRPVVDSSCIIAGINNVIASALWCKGYSGGPIDGTYNGGVSSGVTAMKADMGVASAYPGAGVTPKVFKALLTMDAYVRLGQGTDAGTSVQRWLNGRYSTRRDFFIGPCDGSFSRDVQKSLMLAIQFELGMPDGTANGVFGPGTKSGIATHTLAVGSSGVWVQLFSAGLVFNRISGATFSSTFSSGTAEVVTEFQQFVALPVNGNGDFKTWASLLISYGDQTRKGKGCDCVTSINASRAASLRSDGYEIVGRYLCNVAGGLNKMIQPGEIAAIQQAGLRLFPIFQTSGSLSSYFTRDRGMFDAYLAFEYAQTHGFKSGTTIYFAVDFDALDYQVTDVVIPYFEGIASVFTELGKYYIGIYGPRNVCARVEDLAYVVKSSFVSDMSSGYSGNLGYPLPALWAFDQISTRTVGTGSGVIEIDNNISSGRDLGQDTFDPPQQAAGLDVDMPSSSEAAILAQIRSYMLTLGYGETGSPDVYSASRKRSNEESFDILAGYDSIITSVARARKMRKAYIQAVAFWEMRHLEYGDDVKDMLVIDHYELPDPPILPDPPLPDDSSVGLAQMFSRVAIRAWNYCIGAGDVSGSVLDESSPIDVYSMWRVLREDEAFNLRSCAIVLLHSAHLVNVPRPGLSAASPSDIKATLARYNGTDQSVVVEYGEKLYGLYEIFEQANAVARS